MLTHAIDGKCSVSDVVSWMCAGPAKVYGIEKKGSLIEGYDGDLTLVDLDTRRTITDDDVWTKVGWTPYAGMELTGLPMWTIVDGVPVHRRTPNGSFMGEPLVRPGQTGRVLRFS